MNEALATLKRSGGKRNFLYELPWYIIIGPPGAGKTTALVNSGPEVSACRLGRRPAGRGHRRHALLRLVVHRRSGADRHGRPLHDAGFGCRDRQEELAGLPVAAQAHRARQPINGVILAISLSDLMTLDGAELGAHATEIRNRLQELHENSGSSSRSMLLFTKADLIAGFMEYFGNFDEDRRRKVWGATFQTERPQARTWSARRRPSSTRWSGA